MREAIFILGSLKFEVVPDGCAAMLVQVVYESLRLFQISFKEIATMLQQIRIVNGFRYFPRFVYNRPLAYVKLYNLVGFHNPQNHVFESLGLRLALLEFRI